MKKIISLILLICTFSACTTSNISSIDLMANIKKDDISPIEITLENDKTSQIMDFSFDIIEKTYKEENVLISPLSIITALGMTANGASSETLTQMENVFGTDINSLNEFLYSYVTNLPNEEKSKINLANSIWVKENEVELSKDFLQNNKNYYNSAVYKSAFDESTVKDINLWVKKNTDNMINKVLDDIPQNAKIYLINALSFDSQWKKVYEKSQMLDDEFTNIKGEKKNVEFMCSTEGGFVELENGVGFRKNYVGGKSFVALLPNEGVDMKDFVNSLNAQEVLKTMNEHSSTIVYARIPKFKFDYSAELKDVLSEMGIPNAFDFSADFSKMTSDKNELFINSVLHKTTIEVDAKGTKAGAVTVVAANDKACIEEVKSAQIYLDRPFLFMIVDDNLNLPIFMGAVTNLD